MMHWIIVAILLCAFGFISFKKPLFGLGFILALLPAYLWRLKLAGLPTTFLELLVLVFLVVIFLKNILQPNWQNLKLGRINLGIFLFILASVIAALVSPEKLKAIGVLKSFIVEPVLLFYAIALIVKTEEDLILPLRFLFCSASLISLFGIIQYFTLLMLPLQFWGSGAEITRITAVFDYPNALALYLAPIIGLFAAFFLNKQKLVNKKLLIAGLVIMTIALVLTFSRGGWLGLLVGLIWLIKSRTSGKKFAGLLLIIILAALLISPVRHRIALAFKDPSSFAHLDLWTAGLSKISQSPILGNGLSGFRTTLTRANFNGEVLNYPHNIILNFWLETGLLGLISFAGLIYFCFLQYKKQPSLFKQAATTYLVIMLIHGFVDVPYFKNDLSVLFWFVASIFYIL